MKAEYIIGLLFMIVLLATSCGLTKYKDYSFEGTGPVLVEDIPDGYLSGKEIREKYNELIDIVFFESQVTIIDLDNNVLLQTSISDKSLIIQHKNDFYFNENEIKNLLPQAEKTVEERNKIYYIGDSIDTFDWRQEPATAKVVEVSYADNYDGMNLKNDEWVCVVKVDISTNHYGEHHKRFLAAWKYFDCAETADGQIYFDIFQNDDDIEQMIFKLPRGEKAKYLFIKSPSFLVTVRKIDISQ